MPTENDLDRLLRERRERGGVSPPAANSSPAQPDEEIGVIPRTSLELVKKSGERWSFPYGLLASVNFDPAKGVIVLRYSFNVVTITGRSLLGIYQQIAAQSRGEVKETAGNAATMSGEGVPMISGIEVKDPS